MAFFFPATSHGKGPSDEIVGTVKRSHQNKSLMTILRPNPESVTAVSESLPGRVGEFMTTAEWKAEEQSLTRRFDFSTASRQSDCQHQ